MPIVNPASSVRTYTSPPQAISQAATITLPHGLGAMPTMVNIYLVCTSAENGYNVGDILQVADILRSAVGGVAVVPTASNITLQIANVTNPFISLAIPSGNSVLITNTAWNLIVEAQRTT